MFKNVYKKDRKGNLLDTDDKIVSPDDPNKFEKSVHLKDIHLEKGMHCADCHFRQDSHGTGILYNEPRAAVEIGCIDCHGTIKDKANLITSGFAAQPLTNENQIEQPQKSQRADFGTGFDTTAFSFARRQTPECFGSCPPRYETQG